MGTLKISRFLPVVEVIIILTSFFFFSSRFSPAVSSDDALSVLMTYDYDLSESFYCWGQNRGGTIVPLIAQFFFKVLNFSPSLSESLARYLILILGYLSFRRFFKRPLSILCLALLYFLPILYFVGFTRYSWGLMYSLIGLLLWVLPVSAYSKSSIQKVSFTLLSVVLCFLAIWTMDQAIIPLFFIGLYYLIYHFIPNKSYFLISIYSIASALIILSISMLKDSAGISTGYAYDVFSFNSWQDAQSSMKAIYHGIENALTDSTVIDFLGWHLPTIYFYSFLATSLFSIHLIFKFKKREYFFLLATIIVLFVSVFSSKWVHLNHEAPRYFSGIHFLSCGLIIYLMEKHSKIASKLLVVAYLAGAWNSINFNLQLNDWHFESRYSQLKELEPLGEIGILGSYWYAYGVSFSNPEQITASPAEGFEVKRRNMIAYVFFKNSIYLVKDLWLDEFPEQITQYGRVLKKTGQPVQMAGMTLCEYTLSKRPV